VLVVCPASLKLVWAEEFEKWDLGMPYTILEGGPKATSIEQARATAKAGGVVVLNYANIAKWEKPLGQYKFKQLVLDESHYIKNKKTKRTPAMLRLGRIIPRHLCLSGTPIVNRPEEIWNTLQLVAPGLFTGRWNFLMRYCNAKRSRWGWDFTGSSNTAELHAILSKNCMVRRLKRDVMKKLPAKQFSHVSLKLDILREYRHLANNKPDDLNPLAFLEQLRQSSLKGKLPGVLRWVEDFLATGQKLVVLAHHIEAVDALMGALSEYRPVRISGGVSAKRKQAAKNTFQTDDRCRVLVGNIRAAGVGITLTAASNIAFVELPWSPGDFSQAVDRIHRIGQHASRVTAWLLLGEGTVDQHVASVLEEKMKVLDAVLDGKETDCTGLLREVMKRLYLKTS